MRIASVLGIVLLLSGCRTIAEINAENQAKIAQADDNYCVSIGARFGTPEYANCRLLLTQTRAANQRQAEANSAAMLSAGAGLMTPPATPAPQPMPNILPSQTRCQTYGSATNCSTY